MARVSNPKLSEVLGANLVIYVQLDSTEYIIQIRMTGRFHHHRGKWDNIFNDNTSYNINSN